MMAYDALESLIGDDTAVRVPDLSRDGDTAAASTAAPSGSN